MRYLIQCDMHLFEVYTKGFIEGCDGKLTDEDLNKLDAVTEMTNRVISLGPLGGLAIYALGDDYYQAKMNYQTSRMAIQTMNPSK